MREYDTTALASITPAKAAFIVALNVAIACILGSVVGAFIAFAMVMLGVG